MNRNTTSFPKTCQSELLDAYTRLENEMSYRAADRSTVETMPVRDIALKRQNRFVQADNSAEGAPVSEDDAISVLLKGLRDKAAATRLPRIAPGLDQTLTVSPAKRKSPPVITMADIRRDRLRATSGHAPVITQLYPETETASDVGAIKDQLSLILGRSELPGEAGQTLRAYREDRAPQTDAPPVNVFAAPAPLPSQADTISIQSQISRLTEELIKLREMRSQPTVAAIPEHAYSGETTYLPEPEEPAEQVQVFLPSPAGEETAPTAAVQENQDRYDDIILNYREVSSFNVEPPLPATRQADAEQAESARHPDGGEEGRVATRKVQKPSQKSAVFRNSAFSMPLRLAAILLLLGAGEGARRTYVNWSAKQPQVTASVQKKSGVPAQTAGFANPSSGEASSVDALRVDTVADAQSAEQLENRATLFKEGEGWQQTFSKESSERAAFESALNVRDPRALFEKGVHLTETGTEAALMEATLFYYEASENGFVPALFRLGVAFEKGQGIKVDKLKAASLYERAAEGGNIKAMHNLAMLHAFGSISGKPDHTLAAEWFRKAADHGFVDSQFNYALLAANGLGVDQSYETAFKYFSLAAAQGDKNATLRRDQAAQKLSASQKETVERDIATFQPESAPEEANEKTLPSPPWQKNTWSFASNTPKQ